MSYTRPQIAKWLYRLESSTADNGLWSDSYGNKVGGIGKIECCKTKDLPMDYDSRYHINGKNWFSSCSKKEDLMHWYSVADVLNLFKQGFVFTKYLATDYIEYENETVFLKETAIDRCEISIVDLFNPKKRMAIFGGSFDPFHLGHKAIIDLVLEKGLVDEVWPTPTIVDYYRKDKDKWLDDEQKFEIIKVALEKERCQFKVTTCDYEVNAKNELRKELQGAFCASRRFIHTLIEFRKKLGLLYDIKTIIGTDSYANLKTWFCWEEIRRLTDFIVIQGRGGNVVRQPDIPAEFVMIPEEYQDFSASAIRKEYAGDKDGFNKYLNYIKEKVK